MNIHSLVSLGLIVVLSVILGVFVISGTHQIEQYTQTTTQNSSASFRITR